MAPITIIKTSDPTKPLTVDPIVIKLGCDFKFLPPTREGFEGLEWDWMPKVYSCMACGARARDVSQRGTPTSQCVKWARMEAQKAKERSGN